MSDIQLKQLKFSGMFSYGDDNELQLNKNRITQLNATNGTGKSSIALIIQELLYNKNIKGVKKGDILNRYRKDKNWNGSLEFSVNQKQYRVDVARSGASTKVNLFEEGIDITDHKVLDTYKKIQSILGLDFEIFSQLTYQSSTDLLDFLKATDTNRKKFLINLFNLEQYLTIGEQIKVTSAEIDKAIVKLQGELKSIEDFLNTTVIPDMLTEVEVPSVDSSIAIRISEIEKELNSIADTCKRIDKNNMYIQERESLQFDLSIAEPEPFAYTNEYQTLKLDLAALNSDIVRIQKELASVKINDKCPACGQPIDTSHLVKIQQDLNVKLDEYKATQKQGLEKLAVWDLELTAFQKAKKLFKTNQDSISRFEQLTQLIDNSIPVDYPDYGALQQEKQTLQKASAAAEKLFNEAVTYNKRVSANNAKVDALIEQKSEFTIRQQAVKADIISKSDRANSLAILKKAFSPTGIVAFKLENLTKELETTINYYLSILSDGQFQIEFSLEKEKLNIDVINNGISSPIETVSGGEFSRIQTSILLAIRSLLTALGGSSVNLLFLDEITGVLDAEGKEKLVEVLQREDKLNVFLISHDFTHPLIDKITINKTNNISSINA